MARRSAPTNPWLAFGMLCVGYVTVTLGEALLPPLYPAVAEDLDLDLAAAGVAFGILTVSVAIANFLGGLVLNRRGPKFAATTALLLTGTGSVVAGSAPNSLVFLGGQVFLGLGSGLFFAAGLAAAGALAPDGRRGRVMGLFGMAFSVGLILAAGIAAIGAATDWRLSFGIVAALSLVSVVVIRLIVLVPATATPVGSFRRALRDALGRATGVASVGTWSNNGTLAFLPAFAVTAWGFSPAGAAIMLTVGRVVSLGAKMLTGATTDRLGAVATAGVLGAILVVSGLMFTLFPLPWIAAAAAIVFVCATSGIFPVSHVLAFDEFGGQGLLLGAYRSLQMAAGAVAGLVMGLASSVVGLRATLVVAVLLPVSLVVMERRSRPTPGLDSQVVKGGGA